MRNRATQLDHLRKVAVWLDNKIGIPGTPIRLGIDPLIGLLPGIGDSAAAVASFYFVLRGYRLGVSLPTMLKMCLNILIDTAIGAIPFLGDIFDIGFKANMRNVALIEKDLATQTAINRV